MKKKYFLELFLLLFLFSCKQEHVTNPTILTSFDSIPGNKYYQSEIFTSDTIPIYGKWKFFRSSGGLHGGGYGTDFDYLIVKSIGIFGIFRNDSLLTTGKINIEKNDSNGLLVNFFFEKLPNIFLRYDPEKFFKFWNKDTLELMSPCCDRYNFHLYRIK